MKNLLIVLSEPVPGQEDEYHDWYSNVHLPEMMQTPGFVAAQRFESVDTAGDGPPHAYLAIYEVDADVEDGRAAIVAGRPHRVPRPPAMSDDRKSWWFTSITDRIVAPEST